MEEISNQEMLRERGQDRQAVDVHSQEDPSSQPPDVLVVRTRLASVPILGLLHSAKAHRLPCLFACQPSFSLNSCLLGGISAKPWAGLQATPMIKPLKKPISWTNSYFPESREALITTSIFLVFLENSISELCDKELGSD